MKKQILFIFLATLGLSIASCSNDDNNSSIEATWEITHEGEIDTKGVEKLYAVSDEGNCGRPAITFIKGGTFTDFSTDYYDSKCHSYNDKGTWTKDNNKLTIKYDGDPAGDPAEILELSNSTLKIKHTSLEDGKVIEIYIAVYKRK